MHVWGPCRRILARVELIFVRHGLPERIENTDGTAADPQLQELGHRQAQAMADWLSAEELHAIYVSPMARARQTAAPLEVALSMEAIVRDGLAEFDREHHSYIPTEELKRTDYAAWQVMMQGGYQSMGDPIAFQYEVVSTVDAIANDHPGQRVALVCHGGVVNAYLAHVLQRPKDNFMFCNVDYTSISRVMAASSGPRSLKSVNETAHLRSLPQPEFR